ncbi:phytoene/squalene synthase family protein [Candidatus Binatia bacterium]|nr:phytoene/squalene synthase family protein [Candidatus Binatia bacterium]
MTAPDPSDLAACREVIRVHSRSFHAASRLLPADVRDAAIATYAFCRGADDDVDDAGSPDAARERHARTRQRLDRLYAGDAMDTPVGRAFAWVVRSRGIPRVEPEALLDGMAQDMSMVRIADEQSLLLYCYRAAGVVGRMMSRIMGRADAPALRRAVDLGIAMQLTNIARDVGEDAARDRVYLPGTWLAEAGSSFDEVLSRRATGGVRATTLRVLARAEDYYASGIAGIALLPAGCRPSILSAALLYRAIGRRVCARGGDGVTSRARVGGAAKAALIAAALVRCAVDPRLRACRGAHDTALHAPLERAGLVL